MVDRVIVKIKMSEYRFVEESGLTKYCQSICQQRADTGHFCNPVVAVNKRCPTNPGFDLATLRLRIKKQEYRI
jgi:hypothetical protein